MTKLWKALTKFFRKKPGFYYNEDEFVWNVAVRAEKGGRYGFRYQEHQIKFYQIGPDGKVTVNFWPLGTDYEIGEIQTEYLDDVTKFTVEKRRVRK